MSIKGSPLIKQTTKTIISNRFCLICFLLFSYKHILLHTMGEEIVEIKTHRSLIFLLLLLYLYISFIFGVFKCKFMCMCFLFFICFLFILFLFVRLFVLVNHWILIGFRMLSNHLRFMRMMMLIFLYHLFVVVGIY